MIFDYKEDICKYVVHSKRSGNEFAISFTSMDEVANYVETEKNITGVWKVVAQKIPPEVYTRRVKHEP
jgi:cAMP phosphodiesterase